MDFWRSLHHGGGIACRAAQLASSGSEGLFMTEQNAPQGLEPVEELDLSRLPKRPPAPSAERSAALAVDPRSRPDRQRRDEVASIPSIIRPGEARRHRSQIDREQ